MALALRYERGRLEVLDQRELPDREVWLDGSEPAAMVAHLRGLAVRGAPLIGVAAALSLACLAASGAPAERVRAAAASLRAARPTAVNLHAAVDRAVACLDGTRPYPSALIQECEDQFAEDVACCERMGELGAALISDGDAVLTHCNTGALATAGIGSALGAIRRAWERGRRIHVIVDETRPLLQGARLTTWELGRLGIPHTLIVDSAAASLMRQGRVSRVVLGADRVARNGDFANKVGTYALAVLARHHRVPFHVVAPTTTIDLACPDGAAIAIEHRPPDEVRGTAFAHARTRWAPATTPAENPAFDVTEATLLTSLVTDRAVHTPTDLASGSLAIQIPHR